MKKKKYKIGHEQHLGVNQPWGFDSQTLKTPKSSENKKKELRITKKYYNQL